MKYTKEEVLEILLAFLTRRSDFELSDEDLVCYGKIGLAFFEHEQKALQKKNLPKLPTNTNDTPF